MRNLLSTFDPKRKDCAGLSIDYIGGGVFKLEWDNHDEVTFVGQENVQFWQADKKEVENNWNGPDTAWKTPIKTTSSSKNEKKEAKTVTTTAKKVKRVAKTEALTASSPF